MRFNPQTIVFSLGGLAGRLQNVEVTKNRKLNYYGLTTIKKILFFCVIKLYVSAYIYYMYTKIDQIKKKRVSLHTLQVTERKTLTNRIYD